MTSALAPTTDVERSLRQVRFVPPCTDISELRSLFHEFEIRQLPRLVEERLKRTIREFGHPNSGDML